MEEDRVITPAQKDEDKTLDSTLRPAKLDDFIGQSRIKDNLNIFMEAATKRKEPIEHVLLHGGPGLGKTTLAYIIAKEMTANIRITSGPAIEKAGDLAAILTNLSEGDVLFIDEIHRLNKTIEEILYPAMEDYALDIIVGKGPGARTLRLDLPKFTIIGATTRMSLISSPLRDRFGVHFKLNYYETEEIEEIINRSSKILATQIDDEAANKIAGRSRQTPRVANRLLKRVRDFAQVKSEGQITPDITDEALSMMEIDESGLDPVDRKILEAIIEKFSGGPVGVSTLAAATGEEVDTIEELYEPYLMQCGLLKRTPRGRVATENAYKHLNIAVPEDLQSKLL
ncbi:Holliday junction branch migration DNA helicase RuvB [Patescibacteria group bacterium]|nr:Holliday junction branch migration DNA helicase RuvB [Patescibacteria group bacterium]MBU1673204.1 Holliday junction branch migration DNA helicase RuvB [Patescibacteria group bacterium]MBU1963016.1 Holliday junction branch migration DNA helicase RuvB [Patescibacteria group bacterium]